jgi:hypothetical protein
MSNLGGMVGDMEKRPIKRPAWLIYATKARQDYDKSFTKRPGHRSMACVQCSYTEAVRLGYEGELSDWFYLISEVDLPKS